MALGLPLAEGLQLDLPPLPISETVYKLVANGGRGVSCEIRYFLLGQGLSKDKEKHSGSKFLGQPRTSSCQTQPDHQFPLGSGSTTT